MTPIKLSFAVPLLMLAFFASLAQARSYSSSNTARASGKRSSSANQHVATSGVHSSLLPVERYAKTKDDDGEDGRLSNGPGFILCPQDELCGHTSASKVARITIPPHTPRGKSAADLARVEALIGELDDIGLEVVDLFLDQMERMNEEYDKLWESYEAEMELVDRLLDQRGLKRSNLKVKRSTEEGGRSDWIEDALTFLVSTLGFLVEYQAYELQLRHFGFGSVLHSLLYQAARYALVIFILVRMRSILHLLHIL